jgi:hypothetical protein
MWDWDGFFIGSHLAHQSREQAKYLKWWVLNFTGAVTAINKDGWVPGVLLADKLPVPKPSPILGWFTVKPFLAQGAVIASERLGDYLGSACLGGLAPHRRLSYSRCVGRPAFIALSINRLS